jgi:hypothetical protein
MSSNSRFGSRVTVAGAVADEDEDEDEEKDWTF